MSIPIQSSQTPSGQTAELGPTSPVTGQVSYGWISEAWRLFSAQMGPWIVATLLLFAPIVLFFIVFYAMLWTTMFPHGFTAPPVQSPPRVINGLPTSPLTPGPNPAQFTTQMGELEIGFGLVFTFWASYLYGGMFLMAVRQVRGLPVEVKDAFRGGSLFGRMLGATLLLGLGGYGLEALCLGPMGLLIWLHGSIVASIVAGVVGFALLCAAVLLAYGLLLPAFALMADGMGAIQALKRSVAAMKTQGPAALGFVFVLGLLVYVSEIPCGIGLLATFPMVFLICALAYRDMIGMPNMAPLPGLNYIPADIETWPPAPMNFPTNEN